MAGKDIHGGKIRVTSQRDEIGLELNFEEKKVFRLVREGCGKSIPSRRKRV